MSLLEYNLKKISELKRMQRFECMGEKHIYFGVSVCTKVKDSPTGWRMSTLTLNDLCKHKVVPLPFYTKETYEAAKTALSLGLEYVKNNIGRIILFNDSKIVKVIDSEFFTESVYPFKEVPALERVALKDIIKDYEAGN